MQIFITSASVNVSTFIPKRKADLNEQVVITRLQVDRNIFLYLLFVFVVPGGCPSGIKAPLSQALYRCDVKRQVRHQRSLQSWFVIKCKRHTKQTEGRRRNKGGGAGEGNEQVLHGKQLSQLTSYLICLEHVHERIFKATFLGLSIWRQ